MRSKFEVGEEVIMKGRITRIISDGTNVEYRVEFGEKNRFVYIPEELLERDYGDDD